MSDKLLTWENKYLHENNGKYHFERCKKGAFQIVAMIIVNLWN
jgi:hypothetical protein